MLKTIFFFVLLALACSNTFSRELQQPRMVIFDSIINEYAKKIQSDIKADNLGGSISIAVVHRDKILWSKAFGYSNKKDSIPADTATIYRIGSISKSFAAFLLMQLVEKGVLKLNDPVELYLPEVKKLKGYNARNKITLLELATHTSGLEREPELPDAASGPIDHWEDKVLESIPATAIKTRPGKKFSYSNIGYAILGLALSRAANKPFITLIEENIFVPLQMTNSYFVIPKEKTRELAQGIGNGRSGKIDMETPEREQLGRGYKVPNGGIYSTPNDLLKFTMANMGFSALLTPKDLAFMQTGKVSMLSFFAKSGLERISLFLSRSDRNQVRFIINGRYGLGLVIHRFRNVNIVEHSGSIDGYLAQLSFDKDSKYGVVLLRNYNNGKTDLGASAYALLQKLKSLTNQE